MSLKQIAYEIAIRKMSDKDLVDELDRINKSMRKPNNLQEVFRLRWMNHIGRDRLEELYVEIDKRILIRQETP